MSVSQSIVEDMRAAGYMTAQLASEVMGYANVSSAHRLITSGRLRGEKIGVYWFISAASILAMYEGGPLYEVISKRVREARVPVVPHTRKPTIVPPIKEHKKMGRPRKQTT